MRRYYAAWLMLTLPAGLVLAAGTGTDTRTLNSLAEIVQADEGVPALLGVARVQQTQGGDANKQSSDKGSLVEDRASLNQQIQVQQKRILQLTRTIASLNAKLVSGKVDTDKAAALAQELAALRSYQGEQSQQVAKLQDALTKAQATIDALQNTAQGKQSSEKQMAQLQSDLKASQAKVTELQVQLSDLSKRQADADVLTQSRAEEVAELQEKLDTSQKSLAALASAHPVPKNKTEIRDYAVGISLAKDMLSLLKVRADGGVKVDPKMALAGVEDTFAGKLQVTEQVLADALAASEKDVAGKQKALLQKTELEGRQYMAKFTREKSVKKHPDGFLYRIGYDGDGDIHDTDTVSVVVTESLTNGEVVSDMEEKGTYVSQPVNAYPPLFQKAIKLLKNHGTITLVVPPSLAYGDAGYPPRVPPGATMVYKLRIRDVKAGAEHSGE